MRVKAGDKIKVHEHLETKVTRVEDKRVYFKDEKGVEWHIDIENEGSEYEILEYSLKPRLHILISSPSYIKAQIEDEPEVLHLIKSGHSDKSCWFIIWEDGYGIEPYRSGVSLKTEEYLKEAYGISPNTFYAIYDDDTGDYLHSGRNKLNKSEVYYDYLHYRSDDLGEWWEDCEHKIAPEFYEYIKGIPQNIFEERYSELFEMWIKELIHIEAGEKFVLQDMAACNFSLEVLTEKLNEE